MTDEILEDHQGRQVRLTEERWQHILSHPEMTGQREKIVETLSAPEVVMATPKDTDVHIYHRLYETTPVTRKYVAVAVKYLSADAFILTAYFTSRVRKGTLIWQK